MLKGASYEKHKRQIHGRPILAFGLCRLHSRRLLHCALSVGECVMSMDWEHIGIGDEAMIIGTNNWCEVLDKDPEDMTVLIACDGNEERWFSWDEIYTLRRQGTTWIELERSEGAGFQFEEIYLDDKIRIEGRSGWYSVLAMDSHDQTIMVEAGHWGGDDTLESYWQARELSMKWSDRVHNCVKSMVYVDWCDPEQVVAVRHLKETNQKKTKKLTQSEFLLNAEKARNHQNVNSGFDFL